MEDGDNYNPTLVRHLIQENYDVDLDDYSRTYVAQEMGDLREVELLERVGPDNSGLSRITKMGRAALDLYDEKGETEFSFSQLMGRIGGQSDD